MQSFLKKRIENECLVSDLHKLLKYRNETNYISVGHKLASHEVTQALKQMKNNKTPGTEGISADFLKVFWADLKLSH